MTYDDPVLTEAPIHPLLRDRWSPRVFDPEHELAPAELDQLLEAARWAPSAGNSQPWAFLANLRGEPGHQTFVEALSRGNTGWAPRASALVLTLHRTGFAEDPTLSFSDYAAYDLGQAVAHLTVQAEAMGLATHQFAGFDHARLAAAYDVPAHWRVTTGIAVGRHLQGAAWAAADPLLREREERPRTRQEQREFVFGRRFGVPRD